MHKLNRGLLYVLEPWEVDPDRGELRWNGLPVPIGGRSLEIVEVLVQSAGQIVSKDDLMGRVWPGAFVEENTLQVHVSAVRRALGADRGLLKTVTGQGYRLLGDWRIQQKIPGQRSAVSNQPTQQPTVTNLPLGKTDLIGRSAALRDLQDLITAYRTVTLTGPGGIGKTALALEAARQLLPEFSGDIRLTELVSLSDPGLVPTSAVGALNLKLGPEDITALTVARAIGERRLLLVLDNCEHVVNAAASLVATIVRLCPNVSILATSRELLRIDGEYAYRVPPLDVPAEHAQSGAELLQHSAVQLFVTRAQSLRPTFVPREDDIRDVAAVCRRLDGIPLAIEFAAARAAAFGVSQILSSLTDLFGSLTGGRRTALPRHQTLRATLDWSYELLPPNEQRLLRYLSVFAGGFTLEAACAVLGDASNSASTGEGVANLLAKSLISLDQIGTGRWRLLETTRAYASEKLAKQGDGEDAARRHATYFCDFVDQKPKISPQGGNFAIYGREVSNVRAALDWAFSPAGDVRIGSVLTASYAPVWFYLSSMPECRQQVERALSRLEDDSDDTARLKMQLYIALGLVLAYTVAMEERTQSILTKALQIAERLNDVENQLLTIWSLWNLRGKNGDHRESMRLAELFLTVSNRSNDPADMLVGERLVGTASHFRGKQPKAREHLEIVLQRYVAPTSERHSNWYLYDLRMVTQALLARVLVLQGFINQAKNSAQESLAISQSLNSNLSTCYALRYAVCSVALITSDLANAERTIANLKDFATKYNFSPFLKQARYLEGMLLIKRGEFAIGSEILHTNLDINIREGWSLCYPEALGVLAEGYAGMHKLPEAFRALQRALDWSDQTGERWCDAELFRIKGALILQDPTRSETQEAEVSFSRSMAIARHQGALFWELKAALSLARLRVRQGRPADAQDLLAPVYDRLTEGFDAADLRAAKEILESSGHST